MTTNTHILTMNTCLGEVRELVRGLPELAVKPRLMVLMEQLNDELFSAQTDFAEVSKRNIELNRQLYEPVIMAQTSPLCRYIDVDALEKGAYQVPEFERKLRQACEGTARVLGLFLRKYEKIGYLDFHGESKMKIFLHLQDCFPTMRQYKYKNFSANF